MNSFNTLAKIERGIRTALRKDVSSEIEVSVLKAELVIVCNESDIDSVKALLSKVPSLQPIDQEIDSEEAVACLVYSF